MPQLPNKSDTSSAARPVSRRQAWLGRLWLVFLLLIIGLGWWQRQAIRDWIQLYGYQPPAAVAALADQTTMTKPAEHLFYLNQPLIADNSKFADYCPEHEQTIVLGCYHGGQEGIYILRIAKDSELHGVMQVTAAHEMLHAAYERLSHDDKSRVNRLLQDYYDHGLQDQAIKSEIDAYRKTEPGELRNEMHSIFGTEVAQLPAELERYYRRYFADRGAIVKQAEHYQAAFRSREAAVKRYDAQLARLQASIKQNEQQLQADSQQLTAERQQLEAYKSRGEVRRYNAAVPAYNQDVRRFNGLLATIKQQLADYNAIVAKRNALVVEEQDLVQQLTGESLPDAR